MCKRPYVKMPIGIRPLDVIRSDEARLAATPFPCGQCLPCRINKKRIWKHRLLLESMSHDESVFVTFTYSDEFVPDWFTLVPEHMTNFFKKLRNRIKPKKVRYYYVGEYGSIYGRPHYHAFIFGIGLSYQKEIEESWSNRRGDKRGFVHLGTVEPASADYIVDYVTKGITKSKDNGKRIPEFARMSRKPGIGKNETERIARKILSSKWSGEITSKIIREITHGRRKMPLGRYLTETMRLALGQTDDLKEEEFWYYQKEIFDKHLKEGEVYIDNIVNEEDNKRRVQKARIRFFKKMRRLDNV